MKPLVRWTIGVGDPLGIDCLRYSISEWKKLYGDMWDMAICYNGISVELLQQFGVPLIDQSSHMADLPFQPYDTMWKLCPPRLRLNTHELILDNDVIIYNNLPAIDEFLSSENLWLVSADYKHFWGGFNNIVPANIKPINTGVLGFPPKIDVKKLIYDILNDYPHIKLEHHCDDQGIIGMILSKNKYITIPMEDLRICNPRASFEPYGLGKFGTHFAGVNQGYVSYWQRFSFEQQYKDIKGKRYFRVPYKYSLSNTNKNYIKLKYIIVGTGRCGTVSVAKFLTEAGISCSHERIFNSNGLSYAKNVLLNGVGEDSEAAQYAGLDAIDSVIAESSFWAVPYLNNPILKEAIIIHLVRDPISTILSWNNVMQLWHLKMAELQYFFLWHIFFSEGMPKLKPIVENTPLIMNTYFVIVWNRWIEQQAKGRNYIRVRIESDEKKLFHFFKLQQLEHFWYTKCKLIKSYNEIKITNTHQDMIYRHEITPLEVPATADDILNGPFGKEVEQLRKDYGYV